MCIRDSAIPVLAHALHTPLLARAEVMRLDLRRARALIAMPLLASPYLLLTSAKRAVGLIA
eukprot:scaffold15731_cov45-Phaeocystis_antarctica.AAC.1